MQNLNKASVLIPNVDTSRKLSINAWSVSSTKVTHYTKTIRYGDTPPSEHKGGRKLGQKFTGFSDASKKRLRSLVNAFQYINQRYYAHAMFVTLTLPGRVPTDNLSSKLAAVMNGVYQHLRRNDIAYLSIKELQRKTGNPHWHIFLNKPSYISELRECYWRLLRQHGLMRFYTDRFSNMSYKQYYNYRYRTDINVPPVNTKRGSRYSKWIQSVIDAYEKGVACGWTQPPSVNYEYIAQDTLGRRNVWAYVSKYVTKDCQEGITGKIFTCSRIYVKCAELKFSVGNGKIDKQLLTMVQKDPLYKPFKLSEE